MGKTPYAEVYRRGGLFWSMTFARRNSLVKQPKNY